MSSPFIFIETAARNAVRRGRGRLLAFYLRTHGCRVGKGLKCRAWPAFRSVPDGNVAIGDSVTIGHRVTFETVGVGRIDIGDHVNLTQDILISASREVTIGGWTLVGEHVSIRDSDHGTATGTPVALQGLAGEPTRIGRDVWIGAGCRLLKGSQVADGAVIGAGSVVTRAGRTEPGGIYAGVPIRFVGQRQPPKE